VRGAGRCEWSAWGGGIAFEGVQSTGAWCADDVAILDVSREKDRCLARTRVRRIMVGLDEGGDRQIVITAHRWSVVPLKARRAPKGEEGSQTPKHVSPVRSSKGTS
jgi:hypothetical protein